MDEFRRVIRRVTDYIDELAHVIDTDKNIQEYVAKEFNAEVEEAINDGNYKLAAWLIIEDYYFNT